MTCTCKIPLLDSDLGLDGEDDMCWRCHKPIAEDDDDPKDDE